MKNALIIIFAVLILLGIIGFAVKMFFFDTRGTGSIKTSDGSTIVLGNQPEVTGTFDTKTTTGKEEMTKESAGPKKNIVLVMDDSGSMMEKSGGTAKIDLAKTAADKFIAGLTDNVQLSIVVYGHKGNNTQAQKTVSCQGIEEVYFFGDVNVGVAQSKINKLVPTGWTPIADSLKKAGDILLTKTKSGDENLIVLLSDGEETCGGNPVAVAKELCAKKITTDVIGLGVSGAVEAGLSNIATNGCGQYYDADTGDQIQNAFLKVGEGSIDVTSFGGEVNISDMNLQTEDGRSANINNGTGSLISPDGRTMNINADGSTTLNNGEQDITLPSGAIDINNYSY
ncbi:MAG: VWA domain-containing protein [Candidatus Moranbacteria bacterium]|nr:VWA domain-containing protein [Candidatus Moranbacteria bacterium]